MRPLPPVTLSPLSLPSPTRVEVHARQHEWSEHEGQGGVVVRVVVVEGVRPQGGGVADVNLVVMVMMVW